MSEKTCDVPFERLCSRLQLGDLTGVPIAIPGGLLHNMYAMETTQGKYAVKALNPQIMLRPAAKGNFIRSERIAEVAARHLPALPAIQHHGVSLQEIDDQYDLVFDWIEGTSLKAHEVRQDHCEQIGGILADLHKTDFSELGLSMQRSEHVPLTDWDSYLQKGLEQDSEWVHLLRDSIDQLYAWNNQANQAADLLAADTVISHGDLEPKNVVWNQNGPVLIDWESAGWINPRHDLVETALYWSVTAGGGLDKGRFLAFMGGYKSRYGPLQANWGLVLANGFLGKLGWLEYSLKRSLRLECTDEAEQRLGTAQGIATLNALRRYAGRLQEVEGWLTSPVEKER